MYLSIVVLFLIVDLCRYYIIHQLLQFLSVEDLRADLKSVIWPRFTGAGGDKRRDHATGDHRSSRMWSSAASGGKYGHI